MYIVIRRGAFETIDEGGRLAGLAAVRALAEYDAPEEWLERPGKVVLRARSPSQWARVLEEPHAAASDGVVALPPRRRSERGDALTKIQAMSTELEAPPPDVPDAELLYALNPAIEMSSGKTLAQIAHAAVMADALGHDVSRARVIAPERFDLPGCVAEVRDAGLTEVPPGTITVRVLVRGAARTSGLAGQT
jgi:hypothetical protein